MHFEVYAIILLFPFHRDEVTQQQPNLLFNSQACACKYTYLGIHSHLTLCPLRIALHSFFSQVIRLISCNGKHCIILLWYKKAAHEVITFLYNSDKKIF